ncbi:50S ribosomal protein L15 [Candidatus Woesebacteria bacterium CG_4_10_14_0_2_um_filter_39_14]|uniref:Large ribosomal subunit protein uL15 n=3 Tax=Candidatus Woeseibacteriota TaxID=1752722 RepID=A0A2M7TLW9_9BACT|nr:MAG: 50S ribosomal protein L15 [Candidatus Woesebacteria bacterium CG_4_10_14_0_2_um_filter_39_14]
MTNLPKTVEGRKKRVGRGYGSGKGGHTVGRGQKGQKSRTKIGVLFEGVKVKKSLLKRLPFQRGKGKNKGGNKPVIVNMGALNILPAGSKVNIETLIKSKIVDEKDARAYGVKILGNGKLEKKLIIEVPASKSVLKTLEKSKQ